MAHSLGDGVRAVDAQFEEGRRKAVDFIETHGLRDLGRYQSMYQVLAILIAIESHAIANQAKAKGESFSPYLWAWRQSQRLPGLIQMEIERQAKAAGNE